MDIISQLGGLANVSGAGLAALFVILIYRGTWVPGRLYDQMRRDRDEWRDIAQKEKATNAELIEQNSDLIKASQTTTAVLKAIPPKGDTA